MDRIKSLSKEKDYKLICEEYNKAFKKLEALGFSLTLAEEDTLYIDDTNIEKSGKHKIGDGLYYIGTWFVNKAHFYFNLSKDSKDTWLCVDYLLDDSRINISRYEDGEFYEVGMTSGWTSYICVEVDYIYPDALEYSSMNVLTEDEDYSSEDNIINYFVAQYSITIDDAKELIALLKPITFLECIDYLYSYYETLED
jgi:hypothetical protein